MKPRSWGPAELTAATMEEVIEAEQQDSIDKTQVVSLDELLEHGYPEERSVGSTDGASEQGEEPTERNLSELQIIMDCPQCGERTEVNMNAVAFLPGFKASELRFEIECDDCGFEGEWTIPS